MFLDTPEETTRYLSTIGSAREIAIDTEGASFHRFVDRIYLLQVSTRQSNAIVDPLRVGADTIRPLCDLLESADVDTVLHDADYDLRLLHQDYGWHVRNIFDTRIAAQLIGLRSFGLAALLERYFGVKLDKKHQRADWSMRPLSREMLAYAEQDTMYLLDLRDRLRDELRKQGRWEWAREEFARLEGTRWEDEDPALAFLRMRGARDLTRRELAVFRELHSWRDEVARRADRATFRVIGNEQLLELARLQPSGKEALASVRGVPRGILDNRTSEILEAIRRGLAVAEADLPRFARAPRWERDPDFDRRVTALKSVRDRHAQKLDLDPGVLCSRDRLEAVARRNPKSLEEMGEVAELRRWQVEVLGTEFLNVLKTGSQA